MTAKRTPRCSSHRGVRFSFPAGHSLHTRAFLGLHVFLRTLSTILWYTVEKDVR
ncbi:hypothetical protein BACCAP_02406 [Pseudoflavonifractor capillosus ATCC 29799]|uniref:Uncharacterized protein n=1 Tax=Pseudoflavonifractor capillosus ATCC 29799 TaxID=411467 RepID=A6NW13_9FIRM|nr:hypothetical protein BACCAP_02406 [Pseudoflavonifractor capillosus ATCC 29799]